MSQTIWGFLGLSVTLRLRTYIGISSTLVGLGYTLSIDRPFSYVPYGFCRTFEGVSDAFPRLRSHRLNMFLKISKFSEKWSLESPFLNAYLLDRLCRETLIGYNFSIQTETATEQQLQGNSSAKTICTPVEDKVDPATQLPVSTEMADNKIHVSTIPDIDIQYGDFLTKELPLITIDNKFCRGSNSYEPITSPSHVASSLIIDGQEEPSTTLAETFEAQSTEPKDILTPEPLNVVERFSQSLNTLTDAIKRCKQQITCTCNSTVWSCMLREALEGEAHHKNNSRQCDTPFSNIMERIHHLTRELDLHCENVDRLCSIYLIVVNFLNFIAHQKTFHETLTRDTSLKSNLTILQFFHTSLLATHRVAYWNYYERVSALPAPPQQLPLGFVSTLTPSSFIWKRNIFADTFKLIRTFRMPSNKLEKEVNSTFTHNCPMIIQDSFYTLVVPPISQRMIGNWTTNDIALDCKKKVYNVWRNVNRYRALRVTGNQIVWREQLDPKISASNKEDTAFPKSFAINSYKSIEEAEIDLSELMKEIIALTGAIRTLIQRLSIWKEESDIICEVNKALQRPRSFHLLSGTSDVPYLCSLWNQLINGPHILPFLLGAGMMGVTWLSVAGNDLATVYKMFNKAIQKYWIFAIPKDTNLDNTPPTTYDQSQLRFGIDSLVSPYHYEENLNSLPHNFVVNEANSHNNPYMQSYIHQPAGLEFPNYPSVLVPQDANPYNYTQFPPATFHGGHDRVNPSCYRHQSSTG